MITEGTSIQLSALVINEKSLGKIFLFFNNFYFSLPYFESRSKKALIKFLIK